MTQLDRQRIETYFGQEFSKEENQYLNDAFGDEHLREELESVMRERWNSLDPEVQDEHSLDHLMYKINFMIHAGKVKKRELKIRKMLNWYSRIAAILLLPLFIYAAIFTYRQSQLVSAAGFAEITAPKGGRLNFDLPDGTKGWLNRGSSLRYSLNFSQKRVVQLTGQAYFDVKHDAANQFTVKTKQLDVQVWGTSFDVSAYEDDPDVGVTLVEGKVVLTGEGFAEPIVMKPNDQVTYHLASRKLIKTSVLPQNYTAWKEGKLMLRNASIADLAKQLSRWYNVDVRIENGEHADIVYRATFQDENLEEVLRLLKISSQLNYRFEERVKQEDGTFSKRKVILQVNRPN